MPKEIAISKRAKISEAQQSILIAVLVASVIFGIAASLTVHFIQQIFFNIKVISEEEQAIASYSEVIKTTGVCESPSGSVYTDKELNACNPDSIQVSKIPGTLRSNILEKLAANKALNSVPKENDSACINPKTQKSYTYEELNKILNEAQNAESLNSASQLIKSCSALRVIPDALPAFKNEEALLASLNKIFIDSGMQPESLSPGGSSSSSTASSAGFNAFSVNLSVESDTGNTMKFLDNIERSIREFNIERATIKWSGENTLSLQAQATSYYVDKSSITETTKTVTAGGK